jgi:hypothetical protein
MEGVKTAEEMMDQKMSDLVLLAEQPEAEIYTKLPKLYCPELDTWPDACNLRCWSCTLLFDSRPLFVPVGQFLVDYDDKAEGKTRKILAYERLGVVCTANCAASYIDANMHGEKAAQSKIMLIQLYHSMFGVRVMRIEPAPLYTDMCIYGGTLSEENYRDQLRARDNKHGLPSAVRFPDIPAKEKNCTNGWDIGAAGSTA